MILMSSKHVTVNQMKLLVLQLYKVECCRDPVLPGQPSLLIIYLLCLMGGLTVYIEMFSWCIKMTKFMGHWKQFRSNSGNGCSTSQAGGTWPQVGLVGYRVVLHMAPQGTAPGIVGFHGGTPPGIVGYEERPLPSSSFPQHKYTSIRDAAATHTRKKHQSHIAASHLEISKASTSIYRAMSHHLQHKEKMSFYGKDEIQV